MNKQKWPVKILLGCVGVSLLLALLVVILGVSLFMRLMPGYEVTDGRVYYRSFNNQNWQVERKELDGADPSRIETLKNSGGTYASDGVTVFCEDTSITLADPQTFRVLDWRQQYARDDSGAFSRSIKISDDPDHFEVLTQGYSKDRQHVYFHRAIVDQADPATFVVDSTNSSSAHDKNRRYLMGKEHSYAEPTVDGQQ